MRSKGIFFVIIGIYICINIGCSPKKSDKVLARINKDVITVGDFTDRISQLPKRYQDAINKNKRTFLDELIVDYLLYNKAKELNLDKDEDVRKVIKEAQKKILIARLLKDQVEDKISVSDSDINEFYEANREKFMTPEVLRASHILVRTESEARDILTELAGGKNFEELAREKSLDTTAQVGGDIGYFTYNQLVPEVEEACFNMKVGEISGIVRTKYGYHIIRLTERQEPHIKELSEVRNEIEGILKRRKKRFLFNEFVENLKKKSAITVNENLVKSISDSAEKNEKKPD